MNNCAFSGPRLASLGGSAAVSAEVILMAVSGLAGKASRGWLIGIDGSAALLSATTGSDGVRVSPVAPDVEMCRRLKFVA